MWARQLKNVQWTKRGPEFLENGIALPNSSLQVLCVEPSPCSCKSAFGNKSAPRDVLVLHRLGRFAQHRDFVRSCFVAAPRLTAFGPASSFQPVV